MFQLLPAFSRRGEGGGGSLACTNRVHASCFTSIGGVSGMNAVTTRG